MIVRWGYWGDCDMKISVVVGGWSNHDNPRLFLYTWLGTNFIVNTLEQDWCEDEILKFYEYSLALWKHKYGHWPRLFVDTV